MTTIQFYHLTATPLERALPKLLEKAYAGGFTTLVVADSEEKVSQLDELLWTYEPGSFLPHGSACDSKPEEQPILLTSQIKNTNNANLLFITNGITATDTFDRIIDMFDGNDNESLTQARARWKHYKETGQQLTYFRQTAQGAWEKAA